LRVVYNPGAPIMALGGLLLGLSGGIWTGDRLGWWQIPGPETTEDEETDSEAEDEEV
jgi:predicted NUDIX family NTP pyrophosphohydrolase